MSEGKKLTCQAVSKEYEMKHPIGALNYKALYNEILLKNIAVQK